MTQPMAAISGLRPLPDGLSSNGSMLSSAPERLGWLTPSDPDDAVAGLRARYDEDGYLWLKGLLAPEEVRRFRATFFEALRDTGLLAAGSAAVDGIAAPRGPTGPTRTVLHEMARSKAFSQFCDAMPLRRFVEALLGQPATLLGRRLLRYTRPGDPSATGARYDLTYLRAGTERLVTAWIPIGDVPVAMGGLVYLEGSHRLGRVMEADFARLNATLPRAEQISAYNRNMAESGWISKDLPALADSFGARWLAADYEAGDVVLHGPFTIHAATVNADTAGRMRLSADIRFQVAADRADPRWSHPWSEEDGL